MTTIAAITRIVSAHVGVADVDRWAKALHAAEMLPGLDKPAGPAEAATLLLAVMAAPTPNLAPAAVTTLRGARPISCRHGFGTNGEAAWRDTAQIFPDHTLFNHLRDAIREDGMSVACLTRLSVAEGGAWALIHLNGGTQGQWFGAEMVFQNADVDVFPGLRRYVNLESATTIAALHEAVEIVDPAPPVCAVMPSTLSH